MVKHLLPPGLILASSPLGANPDYNMLNSVILPWDFKEDIHAGIIGVPFNKGTHMFKGTNEGPNAVRETFLSFATRSFDFGVDIMNLKVRDIGDVQMHPTDVVRCHANTQEALTELYQRHPGFVPIIIGGDHAIAAPSCRALRDGRRFRRVGLVDFDAHNDLRDPAYDGPSSGTPFRQLIDGGYVNGRNAVQVGLHGFLSSSVLKDYADKHGLRMVSAREVRQRGIEDVVEEALAQAGDGTDAIYASFDIDAIEAAFAPGTGSHTPGGLLLGDVFEAMYMLGRDPRVAAMDLVELDPIKDLKKMTSRVGCMMILTFLVGLQERLQLYA
ncbi:MAG: agmatinase family protein [Chloroflexi bacterium]|nr:agmatinase family protein [Chloroflexota bacterium]